MEGIPRISFCRPIISCSMHSTLRRQETFVSSLLAMIYSYPGDNGFPRAETAGERPRSVRARIKNGRTKVSIQSLSLCDTKSMRCDDLLTRDSDGT